MTGLDGAQWVGLPPALLNSVVLALGSPKKQAAAPCLGENGAGIGMPTYGDNYLMLGIHTGPPWFCHLG